MQTPTHKNKQTAYFTMEIGLESEMPTYAGGLGMLAADIMRSSADLNLPMVCVTIGWEHGYLRQSIHEDGTQEYTQINWNKADFVKRLEPTVTVTVAGRTVTIAAWEYTISGETGHTVPVYFLDTNVPENTPEDRTITKQLYGGDGAMRLAQEVVLGIGGVRMLRALGHNDLKTYHLNEGHAAFLTLELLKENDYNNAIVKSLCAFTTHTPVKAGHDVFSYEMAYAVAGDQLPWHIREIAGSDALSMTELALNLSRYTCGVSKIHGDVSKTMFPGHAIDSITNGVHHITWAHAALQQVFDVYIPDWRSNPASLQHGVHKIPDQELWRAHQVAKAELLTHVHSFGYTFDPQVLTIATARRVVPYKRPELLYTNLERLLEVANGKLQIIHAGNAHPSDPFSQAVIQHIIERAKTLKGKVDIAYLPNYNPSLAKLLVSGADVWLNTPQRLKEASGTSGMKACLNGVLNLSTLDGWWIEGYAKNHEAGWRIGPLAPAVGDEEFLPVDAEDLYTQLQYEVMPEYYKDRARWIARMKAAIALLAEFSSQRCTAEYQQKVWNV